MPASKAQRAATAERRTRAIAMRLAGADWDTVASQLGYSGRDAACKDVTRAMEAGLAKQTHNAGLLRHQELLRLDRLQRGLWTRAVAGDHKCADTVLRIIQTRVKLLGLDQISAVASHGAASLVDRLSDALHLDQGTDDLVDDGYPVPLPPPDGDDDGYAAPDMLDPP